MESEKISRLCCLGNAHQRIDFQDIKERWRCDSLSWRYSQIGHATGNINWTYRHYRLPFVARGVADLGDVVDQLAIDEDTKCRGFFHELMDIRDVKVQNEIGRHLIPFAEVDWQEDGLRGISAHNCRI